MLPAPHLSGSDPDRYAAVLGLVDGVLISSADLARHWGYSENHLANLRRDEAKGLPFIKLPTGGVRYRLSEVLAAEIAGTVGPITLDRVLLAVAACPGVPAEARAAIAEHLRASFRTGRP